MSSRFKGADFQGGKGKTTHRGTHVPLIASWPAVMNKGRVSADLISSTDLFPTICAAAGLETPSKLDGVSFLPQLRGETGTPREWFYMWYSPRQSRDLKVSECAFDHTHKLYRDGRFFNLQADPEEKNALPATGAAATKLKQALDTFQNARPPELDRMLEKNGVMRTQKKGKKDR